MSSSPKAFAKSQYLILIWILTFFALVSTVVRMILRFKVYRRLRTDDGLVVLAVVCLLVSSIMLSILVPVTYTVEHIQSAGAHSAVHLRDEVLRRYAQYQWADAYLFFTTIWAVKGSFLAFYDNITERLPFYRRAWWVTIAITILTYIGNLLAYAFLNGFHVGTEKRNWAINYQFSADFVTDLLITSIPLTLAIRSHVPLKQKFALGGVFSLTFLITVMSIVRFALNAPSRGLIRPSWINAWSLIEQSTSVIISCFTSFRIYMVAKSKSAGQSSGKDHHMNTFIAKKMRSTSKDSGLSRLKKGNEARPEENARDSMDIELLDLARAGQVASNATASGSMNPEPLSVPISGSTA